MCTVKRATLIVLVAMTAGCCSDFDLVASEDPETPGDWVEAISPDVITSGDLDGSNSGSESDADNASSDRILLRLTAPDGSIITAGDPLDPDQGWIEVVSVHQSLAQTPTSDSPGPASIHAFSVVKYCDTLSVRLYQLAQSGTRLPKAEIRIVRTSGDTTSAIITFLMEGVHITDIQFQSHPDDMPTEAFVLTCEKLSWSYPH